MIQAGIVLLSVIGVMSPILIPMFKDMKQLVDFYKRTRQMMHPTGTSTKQPSTSSSTSSRPIYVALGSSFAAGPGVGEFTQQSLGRAQGSKAYPNLLAKKLHLDSTNYVNASSSGELLSKIASEQLKYANESTQLITITAGGNDVNYTRDFILGSLRARMNSSIMRGLLGRLAPLKPADQRDFATLARHWDELCQAIHKRSPHATIVIVTYISIIQPDTPLDPLTAEESQTLRDVASYLLESTKEAAQRNGCILVDVTTPSLTHCAGSEDPWSTGFDDLVPVHPNAAGHEMCANEVYKVLKELKALPK